MDTEAFIHHISTLPNYGGQIAHIEHIRPLEADYGRLDGALAAPLAVCLKENGLLPLYSHQAQAINSALSGQNVMVATSSASGKTLCYNVPVLQALLTEPGNRALYLFPTKALAQDQLRGLHPAVTRQAHEAFGLRRLEPGWIGFGWTRCGRVRDVLVQLHQPELPTDAGSARAELLPMRVGIRDM
ncbi:MAG: DEAD/DEAH box helicase, partial [Dehalococcoidales bacterium]